MAALQRLDQGYPTLICLFMVMQKSMMKYITRMGQNTGTLKASKNVQIMAMTMPFVAECLVAWKQKHTLQMQSVENNRHQITSSVLYDHNVFMAVLSLPLHKIISTQINIETFSLHINKCRENVHVNPRLTRHYTSDYLLCRLTRFVVVYVHIGMFTIILVNQ